MGGTQAIRGCHPQIANEALRGLTCQPVTLSWSRVMIRWLTWGQPATMLQLMGSLDVAQWGLLGQQVTTICQLGSKGVAHQSGLGARAVLPEQHLGRSSFQSWLGRHHQLNVRSLNSSGLHWQLERISKFSANMGWTWIRHLQLNLSHH